MTKGEHSPEIRLLVSECREIARTLLDEDIARLKDLLTAWREYTASDGKKFPSPPSPRLHAVPSAPAPIERIAAAGAGAKAGAATAAAVEAVVPTPMGYTLQASQPAADSPLPGKNGNGKKTVLLIDDDKDIQRILGFFLPTKGFEVMSISDPEAALELLEKVHPDIILMDLMMPKMTGFELLQRIKKRSEWGDIRIMIGSMRNYDKDRLAVLKCGADEFIAKPYNLDELALRLHYLAG